jgi:predicted transposase YbfD/YdcC
VIVHKIAVNTADADFVRKAWDVPNCRTLICKVREVWKDEKRLSFTRRYFVSSLDARVVSPERFLALSCGHWQVENRLHLVKDRWWDEDKHALFRPGLGEIWSALTDLAVSLLWSVGEAGKPVTKKAMAIAMKPLRFLEKCGY